MEIVLLFDIAFPLVPRQRRKPPRNTWVTKGIRVASKKMRVLNKLKKQAYLTVGEKMYIAKYKTIYKRVIREAKRRENDGSILQANSKTKTVWRIINKETGRNPSYKQDIKLIWNSKEVTNPKNVTELFNSYFCTASEEVLKKNSTGKQSLPYHYLNIRESNKNMFLFPVTESEVEGAAKTLKNKSSAGIDEIPDFMIKQCIKQLKKPLTGIYNTSLESGTFPDQLKIAKVIPVYKKGDRRVVQNYRPIALLSVFLKNY